MSIEFGGIDGIEDTQLMTQESVRKRDRKKMKKAAVKRQAETQVDREHCKLAADAKAVLRSQQSDSKKSSINRRLSSQKAKNRSQESEEQKTSRCISVASRAAARRSEGPDGVVKERRLSPGFEMLLVEQKRHSDNEFSEMLSFEDGSQHAKELFLEAASGAQPYVHYIGRMNQVYHLLRDLYPAPEEPRNFAKTFVIDTEQAAAELAGREMNSSCSKEIFGKLIDILKQHHPHAKSFKMMFEVEKEEKEKAALEKRPERSVKMTFQIRSQDDQRRYQNPTADEVSAVYVGDEEEIPGKRERTVHPKSGKLQSLHVIDPNCDPMTYSLLFPKGQMGWHPKISYAKKKGNRVNVTMREFYAFNLHVRKTLRAHF